jgi:hypothetical protein
MYRHTGLSDGTVKRNARRTCPYNTVDRSLSVPSEVNQRNRVMPSLVIDWLRPNKRLQLTAFGARDRGFFE